jgi:pimeloyl-ACP methyl ester carboxylesterase
MFEKFTEPFYKDFKSQTKIFVESMFPENANKELVKMIADDMSSAPQDVAMQAFWGMYDYDRKIPEKLRLVRVPVYAINATMWPTNEEFNRQLAMSFEAEYMLNCGHFVMLENPKLFNEFLQKFVTKIVDEKNAQNK